MVFCLFLINYNLFNTNKYKVITVINRLAFNKDIDQDKVLFSSEKSETVGNQVFIVPYKQLLSIDIIQLPGDLKKVKFNIIKISL